LYHVVVVRPLYCCNLHHNGIIGADLIEQEGYRPCQVISPQLHIGGNLHRNASNGDTNILINNREITRLEAFMLQVIILNSFKFVVIISFEKLHSIDVILLNLCRWQECHVKEKFTTG
jgi:hypothetical protein